MEPSSDLVALAKVIADWADAWPGLTRVVVFGSRVRGDHRPDSDVDVQIDPKAHVDPTDAGLETWRTLNWESFRSLEDVLPGPLAIHRDPDAIWPLLQEAAREPFHTDRKCICVWLPPKPPGAAPGRPFGPQTTER